MSGSVKVGMGVAVNPMLACLDNPKKLGVHLHEKNYSKDDPLKCMVFSSNCLVFSFQHT